MNLPTIACANSKEAAHTIHRHISTLPRARHLRLLPQQIGRRDWSKADFAEWWFTPSTYGRGYRSGKLFLDRIWGPPQRRLPGLLRAGFALARGFGRQLVDLVPADLVIDANWFWYRFLSDSMAGVLDTPLQTLLVRCEQPVTVDVSLTYFDRYPNRSSDTGIHTPDDQLIFAVDDASLGFNVTREGGHILAPLATATSLRDLALRIEGVPDLTWYWIDIRIGVQAWFEEADAGETHAWDATALWENAMAPWLPWVH